MSDMKAALAAEFTNGEVRQFQGRGGQTFDYIEDETVMDRLDAVLGVGEWSVKVEPISVADGIVKVSLTALGQTFEDFGYATRTDGEQLKEAVSDGIRRCGRFLGIGRYLYKKHVSAPTPVRPALRPVPAPPSDPFPASLAELDGPTGDTCAEHGIKWLGQPGDQYHKKAEGGYCRSPLNDPKPARR